MYKSCCTTRFSFCNHYEALLTIIEYLLPGENFLYSQLPYQSTYSIFLSSEYDKQVPPFVFNQ